MWLIQGRRRWGACTVYCIVVEEDYVYFVGITGVVLVHEVVEDANEYAVVGYLGVYSEVLFVSYNVDLQLRAGSARNKKF